MAQNRTKFHFYDEYAEKPMILGRYSLEQVGDLKCEPGYCVEPHQQWVDEISLVIGGTATFEADGVLYEVHKGMMFLSGRHEVHAIRSSKEDPMRMMYLGFDFTEPLTEETAILKAFFDQPSRRIAPGTLAIQQAFTRLLTETLQWDFLSKMAMESCVQQIICSAYRQCHQHKPHLYQFSNAQAADDKLAYDVLHYLDARQDYSAKLSDLSAEFGYSYSYIAQRFAALTGEHLKTYHTRLRFEHAKSDMRSGISITETSERMGYKSIHAFSRAFRQYEGMTAREFIEREGNRLAKEGKIGSDPI